MLMAVFILSHQDKYLAKDLLKFKLIRKLFWLITLNKYIVLILILVKLNTFLDLIK
jgi:hypothetical protein